MVSNLHPAVSMMIGGIVLKYWNWKAIQEILFYFWSTVSYPCFFVFFRIDQLFDIIVEYPDSLPAIQDLKVCRMLFRILVFKIVATSCFSLISPNFLLFVRLFTLYCRLHGHSSFEVGSTQFSSVPCQSAQVPKSSFSFFVRVVK